MKNFDGYLKQKLGNDYVLLAGGSHKALSDFLMSSDAQNTYVKKAGDTMTGALTVKQYIFGYNYNHAGGNAPAFIFDKPGSNYTGIGCHSTGDTIWFGAATISNGEASWVDSYKQKWVFNGTVTADRFYGPLTGNVTGNADTATNADTVDNIHATGFLRWTGMQNIGSNAPFQAVVDIIKDTTKLNDGGLAFYSYAGDEYTVLIGSRNDATRHGNALKWGYANNYLWMIRMISGSPRSSDWEKIAAGNADILTTSRNLKVNLASASAQSFNGSADATSIGVAGTLPFANLPTMYWANVQVSSGTNVATTPQFGYVGIGIAPANSEGRLRFPINEIAINFRNSNYKTDIQYMTAGNEALVFTAEQPVTSFIFKCGYKNVNGSNWHEVFASNIPTLQLKNQSVYVNGFIANGASPGYNFYVGGTSYLAGNTFINPGYLAITNNSKTLTIGALNTSWYHFSGSDSSPFYFSNSSSFNGTVYPYSNNLFDLGNSNRWRNLLLSGYIDFNGHGYLQSGRSTSFNYGYTYQSSNQDLANSMGMFSGPGGEEGGIVVTPDGCFVYNSSDSGYNFICFDKDLGGNFTVDTSKTFYIAQSTYFAWSRGGFQKNGSSDSYVLLGGGGHKAISDFKIGDYLPLAGGWMNDGAQIYFRGKGGSTSTYASMGYRSSVTGTMHASGGANASGAFYIWSNGYDSANDNGGLAIDNEGVTVFGAGDAQSNFTAVFRVINEDNVAAGPMFYVQKNGNCYGGNFYTTSDARKKQNIHKISDNIKQFEWKETGETSYGFVAQDLEVKHPELVNDDGNMKTVNYNAALSLVVAKLENRVKELEAKLGLETPPCI